MKDETSKRYTAINASPKGMKYLYRDYVKNALKNNDLYRELINSVRRSNERDDAVDSCDYVSVDE